MAKTDLLAIQHLPYQEVSESTSIFNVKIVNAGFSSKNIRPAYPYWETVEEIKSVWFWTQLSDDTDSLGTLRSGHFRVDSELIQNMQLFEVESGLNQILLRNSFDSGF